MGLYLLSLTDGGVAVMRTVGKATAEDALAKWHPTERAKVSSVREINEEEIPTDRTFRDAWTHKNPSKLVDVDMDRARNIWRDKIRGARKPILEALDIEFIRAEETNDETKKIEIVTKKQALRDLPQDPRIEASKTPGELKAVWHPDLDLVTVPVEPSKKEDKK